MHALIVVANPEPASLTHSLARQVGQGLLQANPADTFEIADLFAEGFDPRFNLADRALFRAQGAVPQDVLVEQARIDAADTLVLVFPIYWWSMPALLKGWIDRVFTGGWAYDSQEGKLVKKLRHLRVHLVALGGGDAGTLERHGYAKAMQTQIDHGIFDYCGAQVITSHLLLDSENQDPAPHLDTAQTLGSQLFSHLSR